MKLFYSKQSGKKNTLFNKNIFYLQKPNLLQRIWKKILGLFFIEQWSLLVTIDEGSHSPSWAGFKTLTPPKDRFWADPFPWQANGEYFIFYEELPFRTRKGHISCMKLNKELEILSNQIVLEQRYHLSYPFLFEYEKNLYMLPETRNNHAIELYQCEDFPNKWKKTATLIDNIEAVDTTLLKFNDKWWLFTNVIQPGGNAYDSLYLYHSDSPLSKNWIPHPLNPIVKDIRSARPAGRIFKKENTHIRPSQDCSARYGFAINFNRIECLTETEYKETLLSQFAPPENNTQIIATHTWNEHGNLRVIDAEFWRRK